MLASLFISALFIIASSAAPTTCKPKAIPAVGGVTATQLAQIVPDITSCASATDECRTATQAVPFINKAFTDFNITTRGEKAALLSLMLFESGGFKFNTNQFPAPGNPGQGTRNMMTFPFIYQYAVDTPSTSTEALKIAGTDPSSPSITADIKNQVRALVLGDDLSFASAMWFYTQSGAAKSGCTGDAALVKGLQSESQDGWEAFITSCVGTTVTDDREALWEKTLQALKA
ncbi:hypothetical protein C8J56DRAFT_91556 [Mycena floridula]|nr:hypothetical protein C8J56DRAFT_91556 [Mycena floridula]